MPLTSNEFCKALNDRIWTATRDGKPVGADELTMGPNSIDLSISEHLLEVEPRIGGINLHDAWTARTREIYCSEKHGYELQPGHLYLAASREAFDCNAPLLIDGKERYFVQCIEGRSSAARIGLFTHTSAGFGDFGFNRPWVLELQVMYPTLIFGGNRLAQVYFSELVGKPASSYSGAYAEQDGPTAVRLGVERFAGAPIWEENNPGDRLIERFQRCP